MSGRFGWSVLLVFVLVWGSVVVTVPATVFGMEVVASQTRLDLPAGARSRTFEFVFPLPEEELGRGTAWIARDIQVDGDLGIVEECLSRTMYYAMVRLVASRDRPTGGTVSFRLSRGPAGSPLPQPLPPPAGVEVFGDPLQPGFACRAEGTSTLFRVFDRWADDAIWSRAFTDGGRGRLDEGRLRVGEKYLLEVRQANTYARYSEPARVRFRIDKVKRPCPACHGAGQPPAAGGSPCPRCRGKGWLASPALVFEPFREAASPEGESDGPGRGSTR
ncbi:MAG: hypothetical protein GX442_12965 [Candidatus Riflebacteria bacterium]|nr:hypothetical protein [Candidatus Riflebacteria bacterium]